MITSSVDESDFGMRLMVKQNELDEISLKFREKEAKMEVMLKQKDEKIALLEKILEESKNFAMIRELQNKVEELETELDRSRKSEIATTKATLTEATKRMGSMLVSPNAQERNGLFPNFDYILSGQRNSSLSTTPEEDEDTRRENGNQLKKVAEHLKDEVAKLEQEKFELTELNSSLTKKLDVRKQEISELKGTLHTLEAVNIALMGDIEKEKSRVAELEGNNFKNQVKITQFSEQLETFEQTKKELYQLESRLEKMTLEKERLSRELEQEKRVKQQYISEVAELSAKIDQLKRNLSEAEQHFERRRQSRVSKELLFQSHFEDFTKKYESQIENMEKEAMVTNLRLASSKTFSNPIMSANLDSDAAPLNIEELDMMPEELLESDNEISFDNTHAHRLLDKQEEHLAEIERKNAEINQLRKQLIDARAAASALDKSHELEELNLRLKHQEENFRQTEVALQKERDFYHEKYEDSIHLTLQAKETFVKELMERAEVERKLKKQIRIVEHRLKMYEEEITAFNQRLAPSKK